MLKVTIVFTNTHHTVEHTNVGTARSMLGGNDNNNKTLTSFLGRHNMKSNSRAPALEMNEKEKKEMVHQKK